MTGTTTGPRPSSRTPAPSHARTAARAHPSPEADVERARREARVVLERAGHKLPSTGQKASPGSAERRRERGFALLERRKGDLWKYGEVVLCVVLFSYLAFSLLK